ncbi:hypothetical protein ACTHQ2_24365, partial [Bacillus subtilis]|uniref:hypothetical protein n=1 Tax=Bacillus subtilis TaxID=1423 RepID=UPI003F7C9B82
MTNRTLKVKVISSPNRGSRPKKNIIVTLIRLLSFATIPGEVEGDGPATEDAKKCVAASASPGLY